MDDVGQTVLLVGAILGALIGITVFIMIAASLYRKVSPNQVLIISGRRHETVVDPKTGIKRRLGSRIVQGGGAFVIPFFERVDILSLELITLDIAPPESYTKYGVPVKVDGVAQIKVRGDDVSIRTAAEQFLSKNREEIRQIAYQTVAGHLRATLGTLTVEEIYSNHEAFAQRVREVSSNDLAAMGLTVVSFTIREISDSKGYLEAVGKPQIAKVKRDAAIAEAEADRDSTIKRAQADQEAQTQRYLADAAIAEAERDYNLKKQDYIAKVNIKKAETDLAYDLQRFKETQKVKEEELQVSVIEKKKQIELETEEIRRRELELEATVKKPAEAEKQRIETLANAEQFRLKTTAQGQSEAWLLEGNAKAEVSKSQGLAQAEVQKAQGIAQAEIIKEMGLAEAEAIKAKGLAEAEAMSKRAAAFNEYNEAAVVQMFVEKLPEMANAIAAPLSRIERIVLVNTGGDSVGVSKLTNDMAGVMAQVPTVIEAMTGVDLRELINKVPGIASKDNDKTEQKASQETGKSEGIIHKPTQNK